MTVFDHFRRIFAALILTCGTLATLPAAEAADGQMAVQMFQALRPDCVVLDFSMPVMNGIDAAREIINIAPHVPLLLCTMYGPEQLIKAAADVGVKRVISKNDNLSADLVSVIEKLVATKA